MQKVTMNLMNLIQGLVIITVIVITVIVSYAPYSYAGLVIRGGQCSADAFEKGAESGDQSYIQGLSVNYTTDTSDKAEYQDYLTGITGYKQYCVATDNGLKRNNVKIDKDALPKNKLHAKLSGDPKKIASQLTKYP